MWYVFIVLVILVIAIPILLVLNFLYNGKTTWGGDNIDEKELALRKKWHDDEVVLRHSNKTHENK